MPAFFRVEKYAKTLQYDISVEKQRSKMNPNLQTEGTEMYGKLIKPMNNTKGSIK